MGFGVFFYHDPNVGGGGQFALAHSPQPLLLTTNNQALLFKGPCAPKSPVTRLRTREDLLQFLFFSVIGGHLLSAGILKNETRALVSGLLFIYFLGKNLGSKSTVVYFGVLSKFCFSERPLGQKVPCPLGSSPSTIPGSL
jgi:hypothetical protein